MGSSKFWDNMTDVDMRGSKLAIRESFKKPNKNYEKKTIELILSAIRFGKCNKVKVRDIRAWLLENNTNKNHKEIRKHIQHIRENSLEFIKFGYLLADRDGYWISLEKKEITKYQLTLNNRYRSLALQLIEATQSKKLIEQKEKENDTNSMKQNLVSYFKW